MTHDRSGGTRVQAVEVDGDRTTGAHSTIGLMTGLLRHLAVSRDGRQLAVSEPEQSLSLTRIPLAPGGGAPAGPEEILNPGRVIDHLPAFSPDGRRIALDPRHAAHDRLRASGADDRGSAARPMPA